MLASSGRILSLGERATGSGEVPRLGLDGPCAMATDRSALLCGAKRYLFSFLGTDVAPENLVGELPNDGTALSGDETTWFSVTPTGRVAQVDPARVATEATGYRAPYVSGAGLSRDGRWIVAADGDEGQVALTEVATGARKVVDVGDGRVEMTGQLRGSHGDVAGPLVVTPDASGPTQGGPPGGGAPGDGSSSEEPHAVLVDPRSGAVLSAGLRALAVTSPTGSALATWGSDASVVEIRSVVEDRPDRTVSAPGLGFGPAVPPDSRHYVAVTDDASRIAYVAPGTPGLPGLPGQPARLRVLATASGGTLLDEPVLLSGQVSDAGGPLLAFSPDGSTLTVVTAGHVQRWAIASGTATQLDTASAPCTQPFATGTPRVVAGGTLLYADGRLLDATSLSTVYTGFGCGSPPAATDRSGEALLVLGRSGDNLTVRRLALDVASLTTRGCGLAGRNLSAAEWKELHPGTPRPRTCGRWP